LFDLLSPWRSSAVCCKPQGSQTVISRETGIRPGAPDRSQALRKYREAADRFNLGVGKLRVAHEAIRSRAVRQLHLLPGDTALDIGCGTGLSFSFLVEAVGSHGHVIGIDQSPEMLAQARTLIERSGWSNVTLVNAPAAVAKFREEADAALFHYTHDIMRESVALKNVIAHLRPGARIVAVGIKWAPWWNLPVNLIVFRRAWRFTTTFDGLGAPWSHLQSATSNLRWEPLLGGGAYMACSVAPFPATNDRAREDGASFEAG